MQPEGAYSTNKDFALTIKFEEYTMETQLHIMLEHEAALPLIRQYMPEMLDKQPREQLMNFDYCHSWKSRNA